VLACFNGGPSRAGHTGAEGGLVTENPHDVVGDDAGGDAAQAADLDTRSGFGADFFEQLVETAPDGIVVVDARGVIRLANRQAETLFGWRRGDLVGKPIEVLVPDRVRGAHPDHRARYMASPRTRPMAAGLELTARKTDGSEFPVDISLSPLDTGEELWVSAAIRDATARKRAEAELRQAYKRASASVAEMERQSRELAKVSEMGDMLQSCLSAEEAYGVIAAFAAELFPSTSGIVYRPTGSPTTLEGVSTWGGATRRSSVIAADDCWALRRGRVHRAVGNRAELACRHHAFMGDHGWSLCLPLLAHGELLGLLHIRQGAGDESVVIDRHPSGAERLAVTVAENLSLALANLKLRENLRSQSERDVLTGLYNRRHMDETLEREVLRAVADDRHLSVLVVDVDHFKQLNDTKGHLAGDDALRDLARLLLRSTRGGDVVCRHGGDEFVLVLPGLERAAAVQRAEDLRQAAQEELASTISIGVASLPEDGANGHELLRNGDFYLYKAKEGGPATGSCRSRHGAPPRPPRLAVPDRPCRASPPSWPSRRCRSSAPRPSSCPGSRTGTARRIPPARGDVRARRVGHSAL
jgi:diguanylate cyclase (GGDEF)-like protein/PAS domain S-box-containing protein